jgi:hypothetical protein
VANLLQKQQMAVSPALVLYHACCCCCQGRQLPAQVLAAAAGWGDPLSCCCCCCQQGAATACRCCCHRVAPCCRVHLGSAAASDGHCHHHARCLRPDQQLLQRSSPSPCCQKSAGCHQTPVTSEDSSASHTPYRCLSSCACCCRRVSRCHPHPCCHALRHRLCCCCCRHPCHPASRHPCRHLALHLPSAASAAAVPASGYGDACQLLAQQHRHTQTRLRCCPGGDLA